MRDYAKVGGKFWIGQTGKQLKKCGPEAIVVGLYLMTSPHSNMLGLYYQPELLIAHETGLGFEGASKGLQSCIDVGFCAYDHDSEMVWVFEMAKYQIAETLKGGDKRSIGVQNEYNGLPENPYLSSFFDKYGAAFGMTKQRFSKPVETRGIEAPSESLRSQEQEQEQEQEKEQEQTDMSTKPSTALATVQASRPANLNVQVSDEIAQIFAYWQKRMDSPRSNLDDKRRKAIKAALKMGYTAAELCRAIRGCSLTPHNMGQNERNQKYNGIDLIFRSADQIDRFISNDTTPPRPAGHPTGEVPDAQRQAINDEAKRLLFGHSAVGEIIDV